LSKSGLSFTISFDVRHSNFDTIKNKHDFDVLTPGKQRGYILHFTGAKQSKTITARIEKYIPRILEGFGIHDCICGLSKKHPRCDGSHKELK